MSGDTHQPVFTIGHSNLDVTKFVALLKQHGIEAIQGEKIAYQEHTLAVREELPNYGD